MILAFPILSDLIFLISEIEYCLFLYTIVFIINDWTTIKMENYGHDHESSTTAFMSQIMHKY